MVAGVVLAVRSSVGIYGVNFSVIHENCILHIRKYCQLDEIGGA